MPRKFIEGALSQLDDRYRGRGVRKSVGDRYPWSNSLSAGASVHWAGGNGTSAEVGGFCLENQFCSPQGPFSETEKSIPQVESRRDFLEHVSYQSLPEQSCANQIEYLPDTVPTDALSTPDIF